MLAGTTQWLHHFQLQRPLDRKARLLVDACPDPDTGTLAVEQLLANESPAGAAAWSAPLTRSSFSRSLGGLALCGCSLPTSCLDPGRRSRTIGHSGAGPRPRKGADFKASQRGKSSYSTSAHIERRIGGPRPQCWVLHDHQAESTRTRVRRTPHCTPDPPALG
jgi:hypothetical protein